MNHPRHPHSTHPPNQWLDGTYVFRNAPDRRRMNAKKPRVGGAEFGRKPSNVSTAYAVPTGVRLAPPLRARCDGDHKNALFCQVLQKIGQASPSHLLEELAAGRRVLLAPWRQVKLLAPSAV